MALKQLHEFVSTHGHAHLHVLGATLPGILDIVPGWEALPSMVGKSFWCAAKGADKVSEALAFARGRRQCNLGVSLHEEWLQRHSTVMGGSTTSSREQDNKKCREVGMCICKEPGVTVHRMHNSFLGTMKKTFKDKRGKTRLEQGEVVCQLQRQQLCDLCEQQQLPPHARWYHIGAMSFSPYRPTLLQMDEVETDETNEELDRHCLQEHCSTRYSISLTARSVTFMPL